jgi:hypothetical protein
LPAVLRALHLAKVIAVSARAELGQETQQALQKIAGDAYVEGVDASTAWLNAEVKR